MTDPARRPAFVIYAGRLACGCIAAVTKRESEIGFMYGWGLTVDDLPEADAKKEWGYLKGMHKTWECKNPNRVLFGDPRCVSDRVPIFVPPLRWRGEYAAS